MIISICLLSLSFIDNLASVYVEDSPFTVKKSELLGESFSQPISVLALNLSGDLEIIVTKNNIFFITVEQNVVILFTSDFESEWRTLVLKLEVS